MKYLQEDRLSALTSRLEYELGGGGVRRCWHGRLEAYTMKRAGTDKKYAADLGAKYVTLQETLENQWAGGRSVSRLGNLAVPETDLLEMPPFPSPPRLPGTNTHASSSESYFLLRPPVKRRSQSVGFVDDLADHDRSHRYHKKARGRSNSLDETIAMHHHLPSSHHPNAQLTALGDFAAQETRRLMTDLILTLNMSFPDYDFDCASPNDFEKCCIPTVVQHVQSLLGELADSQQSHGATYTSGTSSRTPTLPAEEPIHTSGSNTVLLPVEEGESLATAAAMEATIGIDSTATTTTSAVIEEEVSTSNSTQGHLLTELWSALDEVIHLSECEVYLWKNHPEDLLQTQDGEVALWSFYYLFVNKTFKRIVFFGCCETLLNHHHTASDHFESDDAFEEDTDVDQRRHHHHPQGANDSAMDADVDLVSEDDDDEEEEDESSQQHYTRILSSGDATAEGDFDLDPSAVAAGGIPISTI